MTADRALTVVGVDGSADVAARRALGPRRSSVFMTPVREALTAPTHAHGTQVSRERTGKGISRQAYGLAARILEAEAWVADLDVPVWEVHPELSFATLLGHPARAPKKTWSGMHERWRRLSGPTRGRRAHGAAGRDLGVIRRRRATGRRRRSSC